jgi:hypothetical protein
MVKRIIGLSLVFCLLAVISLPGIDNNDERPSIYIHVTELRAHGNKITCASIESMTNKMKLIDRREVGWIGNNNNVKSYRFKSFTYRLKPGDKFLEIPLREGSDTLSPALKLVKIINDTLAVIQFDCRLASYFENYFDYQNRIESVCLSHNETPLITSEYTYFNYVDTTFPCQSGYHNDISVDPFHKNVYFLRIDTSALAYNNLTDSNSSEFIETTNLENFRSRRITCDVRMPSSQPLRQWHVKFNEECSLVKDGSDLAWHENGQLKYERFYRNGKRDKTFKAWNEHGQLILEEHYNNGKRDKTFKAWNDYGQLILEDHYNNGKREKFYKKWHDNGTLRCKVPYVNG